MIRVSGPNTRISIAFVRSFKTTRGRWPLQLRVSHRQIDARGLPGALRRPVDADIRLEGVSDHAVSKALYVRDPDGNGVELGGDRRKAQWQRNGEAELQMCTRPLDLRALLKEAATAC